MDTDYITRLHLVKTPWFAVCLHWLNHPDPEPFHHDHPVSFLSIILSGMYIENRNGVPALRLWFNWMEASPRDRHTITYVAPGTLTLCLMGPKTREWGFHMPNGWVGWKDYYRNKKAAEDGHG